MLDCFTIDDWSRSYVLPDTVATNIPRTGSIGMLGSHNHARAVLVETCRSTGATPIALHYRDREVPCERDFGEVRITATIDVPGRGCVVVATCRRSRYGSTDGERWTITLNGRRLTAEDRIRPPSPPFIGAIITRYLADQADDRPITGLYLPDRLRPFLPHSEDEIVVHRHGEPDDAGNTRFTLFTLGTTPRENGEVYGICGQEYHANLDRHLDRIREGGGVIRFVDEADTRHGAERGEVVR